MRKQSKRGFTLVELVIVIAVIAILAGVMIATFANVVKKAEDSRKLQEAKQDEINQKIEDITAKLENADWLGWEDFENELAQKLSEINVNLPDGAVEAAVAAALNEYGVAKGGENTGLTEEQIQTIVNRTLAGSLTTAQVEAIVKKYNSASSLTASQVKQIVEAAVANSLSAAEIRAVVDAALADTNAKINTIVSDVATIKTNTLTEEQIEAIVKKYANAGKVEVSDEDSFSNAIATAEAGSVIALSDNLTLTTSLNIDKNITIDLGDYDIAAEEMITVAEGATVTIKGSGSFIRKGYTYQTTDNKTAYSGLVLYVEGNVVIEGGDFVGGNYNNPAINTSGHGVLTINGGTFSPAESTNPEDKTSYYAVGAFGNGTVVINGGTFNFPVAISANASTDPTTKEPINKNAQIIVNGGTFNGTDESGVIYWPVGTLSVYDGTFTASNASISACGGTVRLYGGTFTVTTGGNEVSGNDGTVVDGKSAITIIAKRAQAYQLAEVFISENVVINVPDGVSAVTVYEGDSDSSKLGNVVDLTRGTTVTVNVAENNAITTKTITLNIAEKFK